MKKKLVAVLLCLSMTATLGACGGKSNASDTAGTEAVEETTEAATEAGYLSASIEYDATDFVKLGDYKNLEVTLNSTDYEVSDDSVNSYADQMITYYKPYVADETKTTVTEGDIVDVDYVGTLDGEAFDGGSAQGTLINTADNTEAVQGTGFIDGFSDCLVGANVGDTVSSNVTFPEDYSAEDLAGKEVTFTFTVNSIEKPVTRETMDDTYVTENFQLAGVDDFYAKIRESLVSQAESTRSSDISTAAIDVLVQNSEISGYPEGLVEARLEDSITQAEANYASSGTTLEEYVSTNYGMTMDQYKEQMISYIEESLGKELVLECLAKAEKIEVNEDDYQTYISDIMSNYGYTDEAELYKEYGKSYMEKSYLINQATDYLVDHAKVTYADSTGTESAGDGTESEDNSTETVEEPTEN